MSSAPVQLPVSEPATEDGGSLRILIYGLNFSPELTGIGKYTGEMATWLAEQGHDVRVVTAPPYYPAWSILKGYRRYWYQKESHGRVRVWRCPLWVPRKPTGVTRLLHLASFAMSSFPAMLRHIAWKPDVVWVVEPALMCAPAAILTARLSGARGWLHVQDFEVDAAFELGLLRGKWARALAYGIERSLMRRFDVVSTISRPMLDRLRAKRLPEDRMEYFPNWVDIKTISQEPAGLDLRKEFGISAGAVVALYSGNMGGKQGLEVLADAAALLMGRDDIVFVFCGDGGVRDDLARRCVGLSNVRFLPLQPVEYLGALLRMADIHLLPQRAEAADLVMPSKLSGMLASGRAVVATAHPGSAVAEVVTGAGLVVPPGDPAAVAQAVVTLADQPALRQSLGDSGRRYSAQHLDGRAVLSRFEARLAGVSQRLARVRPLRDT